MLRVESAARSVRFYCGRLGFRQDWWHQASPEEPATVSVSRGGAGLILTERTNLGASGSQVCVWTIELATLFAEWGGPEDVALEHGPTAMPWGFTEMAFRDPDGNRIRGRPTHGVPDMNLRPMTLLTRPVAAAALAVLMPACELVPTLIAQAPAAEPAEPGWVQLFNGKDLTGWVNVGEEKWTVEDGTIHGVGVTKGYGYLRTEKKYKDFELTLRFKCEGDGNSGVFFHTDFKPGTVDISQGMQFEIDRMLNHHTGGLVRRRRQWIAWPAPEHEYGHPADRLERIADAGGRQPLHVAISTASLVVDFTDPTPKSFDGYISLQLHSGGQGNMRFKDIYIRDLSKRWANGQNRRRGD